MVAQKNVLVLDFETRSACDIRDSGPWKYASDPTTQVLCLAAKFNDEIPILWYEKWTNCGTDVSLKDILTLAARSDVLEAHNAEFERAIFEKVLHLRWPITKWRCTAARAAACSLPRDLGRLCEVLKTKNQKDMEGNKLMRKYCIPRKATKEEDPLEIYWHEDAEGLRRIGEYCLKDVEAEHEVSQRIPHLTASEQELWFLDQEINRRGFEVDRQACRKMISFCSSHVEKMTAEFASVTCGVVERPTQLAQLKTWAASRGVVADSLDKESLSLVLAEDIPADVRRALEIRQSLGRSSTAKYQTLLDRCCTDGRARSTLMFHGAATGRWTGKGFQPHNLPSRDLCDEPDVALERIVAGADPETMQLLYGDPMWVASSCVRSVVTAAPGKKLVAVDLASIEARVLAWMAGEEWVLEAYRRNEDLYKLAAAAIYHKGPKDVSKTERQIGKVSVLSCGYQGGVGAFTRMAEKYGVVVPEEEAATIVRAWRESRPATVRYWKETEKAAMSAIQHPGQIVTCGKISFRVLGGFLAARLPSGRCLRYPMPYIGTKKLPWLDDNGHAKSVPAIWFWGIDERNQWARQSTYGGCLAENMTQAISRDVLSDGMLRVAKDGKYDIVLHVHDEIVAETQDGTLEDFTRLVVANPDWAPDLPLGGSGWEGFRYRK